MSLASIAALLAREVGLNASAAGAQAIELAVGARRAATGCGEDAYLLRLGADPRERQALVEELVVPETWFFRNGESFRHLQQWVRASWIPAHGQAVLRVLSLPCSSGEEAYSLAMALTELGLAPGRFAIDAVDVSERALEQGRRGVYRGHSFRGDELDFRERFFVRRGDEHEIAARIRDAVRFLQGNVLDRALLADQMPYDVIFCRNLLIYLDPAARRRTVDALVRLLKVEGRLYVGHAEALETLDDRFVGLPDAGTFAYQRRSGPRVTTSTRPAAVHRPAAPALSTPPAPPAPAAPLAPAASDLLAHAAKLANDGHLLEAAAACQRHLAERGPGARGYCLMGVIRLAELRLDEAETFFNRALYLDRNHYESLAHLAILCDRRGDQTAAMNFRRRAERAGAGAGERVG